MILEETLRSDLASLGLTVSPAAEAGLRRYAELVTRWNARVRLVGRTDPEVLARTHFADALTCLPFLDGLPAGARVLDVGTGAGLPGLALALARPALEIHLVEVDRRKTAFLKAAVAELGLASVRVHGVRAEGRPEEEGVPRSEVVVSRAFTAPDAWVPLAARYVAPGGRVLAMMAAQAPEDAELRRLGAAAGLVLERVWRGALPGEAGRRVIAAWRAPAA